MFYFSFVFILITIFLLVNDPRNKTYRFFILVMASYTLAIFALMFYLSKDTYYYNIIFNYFSSPRQIWQYMMFSDLSRELIIIIMNFASLSVLYFAVRFALAFYSEDEKIKFNYLESTVLTILILEFIFYNPYITKVLYIQLTESLITVQQFEKLQSAMHMLTMTVNLLLILLSILIIFRYYMKSSPLKIIRANIFTLIFCYILVIIPYWVFFGRYPITLIKISKYADLTTFMSMPLYTHNLIHKYFPVYLIITFIIIVYALYRTSAINNRISRHSFSLSKQIAASDTTSKVFCHYMKNELLAIQSELDTIASEEVVQNVINRCENLYDRLDIIHKSTKSSELFLMEVSINDYISDFIKGFSYELEKYDLTVTLPKSDIYVMLDTNYFSQALHNLVTNALDSMESVQKNRKKLDLIVTSDNQRVILMIRDYGIGMTQEALDKIFTPFYSSEPITKHWGIGLTLTHKIVTAHEGLIEVESNVDEGTTVKVLLPQVDKHGDYKL